MSIKISAETKTVGALQPKVLSDIVIKAWVVRNSAFSIQCGGLERLFVHFSKPKYMLELLPEKNRDSPFGDISFQDGIYRRLN